MNFIASSIRNKLMLICRQQTALLLAAALAGMFVQWRSFNQIESIGRAPAVLRLGQGGVFRSAPRMEEPAAAHHRRAPADRALAQFRGPFARSARAGRHGRAEEGDPHRGSPIVSRPTANLPKITGGALDEYRIDTTTCSELEKRVRDSDKDASVLLDELVARLSRSVEARTAAIEASARKGALVSLG